MFANMRLAEQLTPIGVTADVARNKLTISVSKLRWWR